MKDRERLETDFLSSSLKLGVGDLGRYACGKVFRALRSGPGGRSQAGHQRQNGREESLHRPGCVCVAMCCVSIVSIAPHLQMHLKSCCQSKALVLDKPQLADAILARVVHSSPRLTSKGDTARQKEGEVRVFKGLPGEDEHWIQLPTILQKQVHRTDLTKVSPVSAPSTSIGSNDQTFLFRSARHNFLKDMQMAPDKCSPRPPLTLALVIE